MMQALAPAFALNFRMSFPTDPPPPSPRAFIAGCAAALWLAAGCTTPAPAPVPPPEQPAPAPAPAPQPAPEPTPAPAPQPAPAVDPAQTEADTAARRLLAFHERLRELSPADLAREVARLGEPAEPVARLELALVLAQTRQNGDLGRALALIEPVTKATPPGPLQKFARLLQARLLEQRRLEEQLERQNQQLREQQRRLDQLTSQIEALRAIERSLTMRPAAPPAAPGAAPR